MAQAAQITKDITAFAEFLSVIDSTVTPEINRAIRAGRIALRDSTLYTARKIGKDKQVELCTANDGKDVGFTNLDRRSLEANNFFIATSIRILCGNGENAKSVEYRPLEGSMLNGELELKVGTKVVIPSISLTEFNRNQGGTGRDVTPGEYRLENPIMIGPQTGIIPTIKFAVEGQENTCIRIEFHGVQTVRN